MAITEGYVQGPPQSTGEKIDVTKVTQSDGTVVDREGAWIADPEQLAYRANVRPADPAETDLGVVTRPIGERRLLTKILEVLAASLTEQRVTNELLKQGLNVLDELPDLRRQVLAETTLTDPAN